MQVAGCEGTAVTHVFIVLNKASLAFVILPSIFMHQHVRECAGVSGSVRECAGVRGSERGECESVWECAWIGVGVSAKINRRMIKTASLKPRLHISVFFSPR